MIGRWKPNFRLPGKGSFDEASGSLRLPDATGDIYPALPAPYTEPQLQLWVRPRAGICFPIHPAGVLNLHEKAANLLDATVKDLGLSKEERRLANRALWRAVYYLYGRGRPIREAVDCFVEMRTFEPNTTGMDEPTRNVHRRVGYLAGWAAITAACTWAAEVK